MLVNGLESTAQRRPETALVLMPEMILAMVSWTECRFLNSPWLKQEDEPPEILNILALSPADHGTDGEKQDIVKG